MSAETDAIRGLYGFNWASVGERDRGLDVARGVLSEQMESWLSPEVGRGTVSGVAGLKIFAQALEQDFVEFRYTAEQVVDVGECRVLVIGSIHGRGRASSMPFTGPFGHVWTLKDGRAVEVRAYLDHAEALAACS